MEKETQAFCDRLGIRYTEELVPFYTAGKALWDIEGFKATDKTRIIELSGKYNIFRTWLDTVLEAAEAISQDSDLMLHIYILIVIIKSGAKTMVLDMPDRERLDTDFTPLFAILYFAEDMIASMQKKGLPYEIISDTLYEFDINITDYYELYKRPGIKRYVNWLKYFVDGKILRIGRLNFEMTTLDRKIRAYQKSDDVKILMDSEYMHINGMVFGSAGQCDEGGKFFAEITENGSKITGYTVNEFGDCIPHKIELDGYMEVARYGDNVISVHIPSGEPLTPELCEQSYKYAVKIFAEFYPEFDFKLFVCISWMMEKRLKQIMGKDTNITRFAEKYCAFPVASAGKSCYSYIFHLVDNIVAPENLPENNSLQKVVKQYILNGNNFYEKGGLFLK